MASISDERIELEKIKVNRRANIQDAANALSGEYDYILGSIDRSRTMLIATPFGSGQEASSLDSANAVKTELHNSSISKVLDPSNEKVQTSKSFFNQWSSCS